MNDTKQRQQAAEEVLAEMAQNSPEIGWVKQAIAAVRTGLRANIPGLADMKLSDGEIVRDFLAPARAFVERGANRQGGPVAPAISRSTEHGIINAGPIGMGDDTTWAVVRN